MRSRLEILVDLLHSQDTAALATQSSTLPGHPFPSTVAFAPDEHHRPLLLISQLAEHTRNLAADPKAGFLISKTLADGEIARASLLGRVVRVEPDALLVARYLRYQPAAERFLKLGDFSFHRFEPERVLVVGGFAQAGWLEGKALLAAPSLGGAEEAALLAVRAPAPGIDLLGMDLFGIDLRANGLRRRVTFDDGPREPQALAAMELPPQQALSRAPSGSARALPTTRPVLRRRR